VGLCHYIPFAGTGMYEICILPAPLFLGRVGGGRHFECLNFPVNFITRPSEPPSPPVLLIKHSFYFVEIYHCIFYMHT
jgi:hypothetical protein